MAYVESAFMYNRGLTDKNMIKLLFLNMGWTYNYYCPFLNNDKYRRKSTDGTLEIRTQDCSMVGADKSIVGILTKFSK